MRHTILLWLLPLFIAVPALQAGAQTPVYSLKYFAPDTG
jgi:hypothetical protein